MLRRDSKFLFPATGGPNCDGDKHGRPICLECGQPGHVQRNCPPPENRPRPVKLESPATVGQAVGDIGSGEEENPGISAFVGTCPQVEVEVSGIKIPCMLDTGSQVTMCSLSFFQKWLGPLSIHDSSQLHWLTLKAANGLKIPYVGYGIVDFVVGGISVPAKGIVVVEDRCIGADQGILGMNIIGHCWKELFRGVSPGVTSFTAAMGPGARRAWKEAFAFCRRTVLTSETEESPGTARLFKTDSNSIPANCEKLLWARAVGGSPLKDYYALVEDVAAGPGWQVARAVVRVQGGRLPLRLLNLNPYPLELPRRRPLANITPLDPIQICGDQDLVLCPQGPGRLRFQYSLSKCSWEKTMTSVPSQWKAWIPHNSKDSMPSSPAGQGYSPWMKRILVERMLSCITSLLALLLPVGNVTGLFHRAYTQNCDSCWGICCSRGSLQKAPVLGLHLWSSSRRRMGVGDFVLTTAASTL